MLMWVLIFFVSITVLVKSSDKFTEAAEKIGIHFGLPPFIIGVTIVSIGTSLPELISSIFAVIAGSSEIVVGNVIGSNIANILLVLGMAAIASKKVMKINFEFIQVDLPLLIGSTFILVLSAWDGKFTFFEGILSILLLIVYFSYTAQSEIHSQGMKRRKKLTLATIMTFILSTVLIFFGAKYTIDSVIALAPLLGVSTEIIALTAVALGTSLPELMVSVTAALKGKSDIAVGNVLGSNIFNSLAVMGIPALFETLVIPQGIISFSLPLMVGATFLYFFVTASKRVTKWEGWMLLLFYIFFITTVTRIM